MASSLTGLDKAFVEHMIPHHAEAIKMATEYLARSDAAIRLAKVAQLARGIVDAQKAEIAEMKSWLPPGSKPAMSDDPMPGKPAN